MENKSLRVRVAFGVLFVFIGLSFLMSDFVAFKREETFERVNIELNDLLANADVSDEDIVSEESIPDPTLEVVEDPSFQDSGSSEYETFAGVLNIPRISFSKGFYAKGSELNNVKFNLKILDVSSYPDEVNGNVIITGHSGNYTNSYFANLYQLELGDTASILYKGKTYNYKIVDIYYEEKDGTVNIYRDEKKSCLTLITCTKDDDTKQTIYILERF